MSKNEDDFFGGFFDFNGDGETSIDEEWVAFKIIEDINKRSKDKHRYSAPRRARPYRKPPAEPIPVEVQLSRVMAAPNQVQYRRKKREYQFNIISTLILSLILIILPVMVICFELVPDVITDNTSRSATLTLIVLLLVIFGCLASGAYSIIRLDVLKLRRLKTNYLNTIGDREQTDLQNKC